MVEPQQPQPGDQPNPQWQQPPPQQWQPGSSGPPAKRVGAGGCLVSIGVFVLSCIVFFGLLAWAIVGVVNSLKDAPTIPLGTAGEVTITQTGEQFIFLGNTDGGTIPIVDPVVTVTGPDGNVVPLSRSTTSSGNSGGATFRSIAEFNVTQTGTYTVDSTSAEPRAGANIYVTNVDVASVGVKVGIAFLLGGLLLILSIILAIVWFVRRSRAKKALPAA